jgi:hypothetical protein
MPLDAAGGPADPTIPGHPGADLSERSARDGQEWPDVADHRKSTPFGQVLPNPDGSDRLFAGSASLVAPMHYWGPVADPKRDATAPDLEGDVLVNLHDGESSRLWRMPFDATR